ncbi:MAG: DUF4031 domain-containing protein [Pigmentiphaga sp.]
MTVYVDDMRAPFRRMIMCHMIADTEAELHAMASQIGVARRWYQGDHYDICQSKREKAVKLGAKEVTQRQLAAMAYLRRIGHEPGDPTTAPTRMLTAKRVRRSAN